MFVEANNITNIVPSDRLLECFDQLSQPSLAAVSTHLLQANESNLHLIETIADQHLRDQKMQLGQAIKLLERYWSNMSYLHFLSKLLPNEKNKQINLEFIQMTI